MTNGQTVIWHCAILFSAFHVVTRVNTSVQLDNIRKIADGKESNGTGRTKESVEWHLITFKHHQHATKGSNSSMQGLKHRRMSPVFIPFRPKSVQHQNKWLQRTTVKDL